MDVLYERCAGLDLHKRSITACRMVPGADGRPTREIRTFGTMTAEVLALGDWLEEGGVTHVAMESTGVYWKPVWNLFEERFRLLLVNAAHVKVVPGRKRDVGMRSGWPSCCGTDCCGPALCRIVRHVNCGS